MGSPLFTYVRSDVKTLHSSHPCCPYTQAGPAICCVLPLMFILVMPIEHGLWPVFDIKSHAEGLAGCSTDQISTRGKEGGFNWF